MALDPEIGTTEQSDAALVSRAQRGDVVAFETLARRHVKMVLGLLRQRIQHEHEAKDLAQETLLSAFKSLPQLDDPARFPAWLYRIALNKARSSQRARRLTQQKKTIRLPEIAGGAWTADETQTICALLAPDAAQPAAPGEITVYAPQPEMEPLETAILGVAAKEPPVLKPADWMTDTERKLSRKVTFEFVDQTLEDALNFLNSLTKINLIINPALAVDGANKTPITVRMTDETMGSALAQFCVMGKIAAVYQDNAVYLTKRPAQLSTTLCAFDLQAAVAALAPNPGADKVAAVNSLREILDALVGQANGDPSKFRIIRSRYCGRVDPWTSVRIATILEETAKTGNIPGPPPAPWFFKTLK